MTTFILIFIYLINGNKKEEEKVIFHTFISIINNLSLVKQFYISIATTNFPCQQLHTSKQLIPSQLLPTYHYYNQEHTNKLNREPYLYGIISG